MKTRRKPKAIPSPDHWFEDGFDLETRTVKLFGPVDDAMMMDAINAFHVLEKHSKDLPARVLLSTNGGDEMAMFGIFDTIRLCPFEVSIIGIGLVASAGAILLQAGDKRAMTQNSWLMHHTGSMEAPHDHVVNVKAYVEHLGRLGGRSDAVMLEAVNSRGKTPMTLAQWQKRDVWDRWLDANQALEWGLIDEIL